MNKTIIITILVAILGIYFIGTGMTGLVVSQSCCFPPDCDKANMCDAAQETFNTPFGSYLFLIFGSALIIIAIGAFVWPKHLPDV
ncbi:hypothetical protein GF358_02270 [Candidatus Woesearchaeota archaeon]|nr:hypothetical protein [Candidatus Woesearchaeota archaeon]